MSFSSVAGDEISDAETPLLCDAVDGVVDWKGRPVNRSKTGRWRSAAFIIGVEVAERFSYYGIASNLIRYLKGPMGQSTATAAANVNTWSGVSMMLPLFGAFIADSFLGRYRTIIAASLIYIVGLGFLTLSAVLTSTKCIEGQINALSSSCSISQSHIFLFFFSLYLVAAGQGGHKPCAQAFGADQFDGRDPEEGKAKSSFFNWWCWGISIGPLAGLLILNYIQDNISWALGYGIPCAVMAFVLLIFLLGTPSYRYTITNSDETPFTRIGRVFVNSAKNWRMGITKPSELELESESESPISQQFGFLNRAVDVRHSTKENQKMCSHRDVEEAKTLLRLIPIWTTCLIYAVVFAQSSTFFTEQGVTMDRAITSNFHVPPATLQSFINISILLFTPIYDWAFVPIARIFTKRPAGITVLQRVGVGMVLSIVAMVVAALVEEKRLQTAIDYGLVDMPHVTVPMSIWWLAPQFLLFGLADVFTITGLQEFFYDQVPSDLRSIGLSLYLSIFGFGGFLSSFLISFIQQVTAGDGGDGWFSSNLNRGHLDYFYWLLAALSMLQMVAYLYFTKYYIYSN